MLGILADNDVAGHVQILQHHFESDEWRDIWHALNCTMHTFEGLHLSRDAPDRLVWQRCQEHQIVLLTGNRNDAGPDALESAIRELNNPVSLPVITLADPDRIRTERSYAEQAAVRVLEYLMDIENLRGTGRLFIP